MRFALAGLLGLIVPGAGHLYLGRRRAAAIFAAPVVVLALVALAILVSEGPTGFLGIAVAPGVLPALAALNLALWAWRFVAGIDAARRAPFSRVGLAAFALGLTLLVVVPHAFAGRLLWSADDLLTSLFVDQPTPTDPLPSTSPSPTPTPTPTVEPTPPSTAVSDRPRRAGGYFGVDKELPEPPPPPPKGPYSDDGGSGTLPPLGAKVPWDRPGAIPWGDDGRFDLLLMGADAGAGRWSRRVDSLVLVEIDVATGKVAMISIPRNLQNAPYPPGPAHDAVACGCQTGLINEMFVEATVRHPDRWPGTGSIKGIGAIRAVASELTGRPIDAVLIVDMMGVIRVVDAMGGVDITIPSAVTDTHYPDPIYGTVYQHFDAGFQHLDGREALAYARTRNADSDYARMGRQQTLLLAIRDQLSPATILDGPALFEAAKGTAWTDLPRSSLPNLVDLFSRAADASVKRLSLVPPTYSSWLTDARLAKIQADVAKILGPLPNPTPTPSPEPSPSPSPEPSAAVTPDPTATATPDPTPTTSSEPTADPPAPPSDGPSPSPS